MMMLYNVIEIKLGGTVDFGLSLSLLEKVNLMEIHTYYTTLFKNLTLV